MSTHKINESFQRVYHSQWRGLAKSAASGGYGEYTSLLEGLEKYLISGRPETLTVVQQDRYEKLLERLAENAQQNRSLIPLEQYLFTTLHKEYINADTQERKDSLEGMTHALYVAAHRQKIDEFRSKDFGVDDHIRGEVMAAAGTAIRKGVHDALEDRKIDHVRLTKIISEKALYHARAIKISDISTAKKHYTAQEIVGMEQAVERFTKMLKGFSTVKLKPVVPQERAATTEQVASDKAGAVREDPPTSSVASTPGQSAETTTPRITVTVSKDTIRSGSGWSDMAHRARNPTPVTAEENAAFEARGGGPIKERRGFMKHAAALLAGGALSMIPNATGRSTAVERLRDTKTENDERSR